MHLHTRFRMVFGRVRVYLMCLMIVLLEIQWDTWHMEKIKPQKTTGQQQESCQKPSSAIEPRSDHHGCQLHIFLLVPFILSQPPSFWGVSPERGVPHCFGTWSVTREVRRSKLPSTPPGTKRGDLYCKPFRPKAWTDRLDWEEAFSAGVSDIGGWLIGLVE